MEPQPYTITVFGASGFTGRLIVARISSLVYDKPLKWAIAGRSKDKLEDLAGELEGLKPEIILADFYDEESLLKMTDKTRILINVVGPYDIYGDCVIEACLTSGTHYLDITGEPAFFHRVFQKYHQQAKKKGICIINAAGFDSIPADFGAWLTARNIEKSGQVLVQAFLKTNARFSSGTWRTAIHATHQRLNRPKPSGTTEKRHSKRPRLHKSKLTQRWAVPMPVLDHHVVKRTAKSMPEDYGTDFRYEHYLSISSLWKVIRLVIPLFFFALIIKSNTMKRWLESRFPQGEGPDEEARARSFFEIRFYGTNGRDTVLTTIAGGDPGYDETSKMVVEAAFEMLNNLRSGVLPSGVCTPVQALGDPMVIRLRKLITIREQGLTRNQRPRVRS
jgi:short subunit dehydrogenase-like uncharacterized protein